MTCLVHNPRYRSLFHGVINDFRNEKRIPVPALRSMPNSCCTCENINTLTLVSVLLHETDTLKKLTRLDEQIRRDRITNPKLVLAYNRLENYIKENRQPAAIIRQTSSSSNEGSSENTDIRRAKKPKKSPKTLKKGVFLYLPYVFEDRLNSDELQSAKQLKRGRFFGREKYLASLEKEHDVSINMITSSTSEQITVTLEHAKAGLGNVSIHNPNDLSNEEGEWIFIGPGKEHDKNEEIDFNSVIKELKTRWHGFLTKKRRNNDCDEEKQPHKK